MPSPTLDRVLLCPNLPSLPAAALSIIEMMQDPNVTLDRIARTIHVDPALATRVLRVANSSFYALRSPCASISRALGLMGLKAVRSIVLGFSLVDGAKHVADGGFDLTAYWRRGVLAAAASKLVAETTKACDRDEALLAALIQDIGMLASYAALREDYAKVVAQSGAEHSRLCGVEMEVLGFTHPEVGERLALKWRLPANIASCIRSHHGAKTEASPSPKLMRAVMLGTLISEMLTEGGGAKRLLAVFLSAREWFSLDEAVTKGLIEKANAEGRELARSLEVDSVVLIDVAGILAAAQERLLESQIEVSKELEELRQSKEQLTREADKDSLTGANTRKSFDSHLEALFAESAETGTPLGLLFVDADHFKRINDVYGHATGDAVLVGLVARIRAAVGDKGEVSRYGGEEFTVLLPGASIDAAEAVGRAVRTTVASAPIRVQGENGLVEHRATVSVGAASLDRAHRLCFASPAALVEGADRAAYAAKRAGRNRVCTAVPPGATGDRRAA